METLSIFVVADVNVMFASVVKLKVEAAEEPTDIVPELAFTLIVWVFCPEIMALILPFPRIEIDSAPLALS